MCAGEAGVPWRGGAGVGQQAAEGVGPGWYVGHGAVDHRVAADFAQHRQVTGHHGRAASQRFDDGQPEALGLAGLQNHSPRRGGR